MLAPLLLSLLMSPPVLENTWAKLPTPRGTHVEVRWNRSAQTKGPIMVVAPGQSCNARRPLFEALESAALKQGLSMVRLEWSYCLNEESKRQPSIDLAAEREDIATVLAWVKSQNRPVVLAGKSLGSLVSYQVFQKTADLKAVALLTPVCSYPEDDNGQPLKTPLNKMSEHYPGLGQDKRSVLLSMGSQDSLCHLPYLYHAIRDTGSHLTIQTFGGGHSLGILGVDKKEDISATQRNLAAFAAGVINWALLVPTEKL